MNETKMLRAEQWQQMEADVVNRAIALRDAIRAATLQSIVIPLEVRKAMDELVAALATFDQWLPSSLIATTPGDTPADG